jgi:hypothetical protein
MCEAKQKRIEVQEHYLGGYVKPAIAEVMLISALEWSELIFSLCL